MSQLYGDLNAEMEPGRFNSGGKPPPMLTEPGVMFEQWFEQQLVQRWGPTIGERPEEQLTAEGIAYSPDLFIYDDVKGLVLGEIKFTWKSSRELPKTPTNSLPEKYGYYLRQMKCYCYHLQIRYARLFVFCCMGDWDRSKLDPQLRAFDIEFTQRELDECWAAVRNNAIHKGLLTL